MTDKLHSAAVLAFALAAVVTLKATDLRRPGLGHEDWENGPRSAGWAGPVPAPGTSLLEPQVPRRTAVEVPLPANDEDAAVLGRPVALTLGPEGLYVADALDCAVKVFSREGRFLRSFGRRGSGPGEMNFPSGVAVEDDDVVVADKLNFRIQVFGRDGVARGGFKLPFPPDRVFTLGPDRLLVTVNPTGRRKGEKLLRVLDRAGRVLWGGLEAKVSADPVADAFRNMILVCPGEADDFLVIFRTGERNILRFSDRGTWRAPVAVDERYAFKNVDLRSDRAAVRLAGFCWAAAGDRGLLYLSAPDVLDGRDLGPGRTLSLIDVDGRLQAVVELPVPVHRFVVEDGRVFAIDPESALRIWEVGR
jgi:hypothetical protein